MAPGTHPRRAWLEWGALAVVAVMPTQVGIPILRLERATVALTLADILVWVLAAGLVVRWLCSRGSERVRWPPVHVWLVAAVAAISAAAWLDPSLGRKELLSAAKEVFQFVGIFVAAPLVFLAALAAEGNRRRAIAVLAAVTAVVCAVALVQAAAEIAGRSPAWLTATRLRELDWRPHDPGNVVGLFGSRTVLAMYLLMALPVLFAAGLRASSFFARSGAALLVLAGASVVTLAGPFLALAAALLAAGAVQGTRGTERAAGVGLALLLLCAAVALGPFRHEKLACDFYEGGLPVGHGMARTTAPPTHWAAPEERPAPPDEELEWAPGEEPADAEQGEGRPAPPDEELEWAPGEEPADAEQGEERPAPPDEELEWAPGEEPEGHEATWNAAGPAPAAAAGPEVESSEQTIAKRYCEWGAGVEMLGSILRPVAAIGVGPGQYQEAIGGYYGVLPKGGKLEPDFQNGYLVIAGELGLMGLYAYVWLLLRSGRSASRALRGVGPFDRALLAGTIGAIVGIAAVNLFGNPVVRGTGVTLALLVSLIVTIEQGARRTD